MGGEQTFRTGVWEMSYIEGHLYSSFRGIRVLLRGLTLLDYFSRSRLKFLVRGVVFDPLHDLLAASLLEKLMVLWVLNI